MTGATAAAETPTTIEATPPAKPAGLVGYIDASSGDRLFGWAWDPDRPAARIAIRLVAKGETVAALIADRPRADLKANGIGDGAHAFEVDLPPGLSRADVELHAVSAESGGTIVLTAPPPPAATGEPAAASGEVLARLIRSHQFLHRSVTEAMTAIAEMRKQDANAEDPPEAMPSARIEAIEAAILRIDALVATQEVRLREHMRRGADRVTRALSGVALILAGAALLCALVL